LKLRKAGIFEVFSELGAKRAASITSVTDADLKRRKSFGDKDEEVLVPLGVNPEDMKAWVLSMGVGWVCRKGMKPEAPNQDSFSMLIVEDQFALYGVYDGHGPNGHDISDMSRELVIKLFVSNPSRTTDPGAALESAFLETQKVLESSTQVDPMASGTTCTIAYHDYVKDIITIAHVGDSRAIKAKRVPGQERFEVDDLTIDHKPNLEKERQRIESADPPGRVVFDGFYNHRVFAQNGMYPGLNMSRAFGDVVAHKEAGLTAVPDVRVIDLKAEREQGRELVLLICTDGVWEFIESQEASDMVEKYPKEKYGEAVEKLAQESWDRWMNDSDNEISDDITAIMIRL